MKQKSSTFSLYLHICQLKIVPREYKTQGHHRKQGCEKGPPRCWNTGIKEQWDTVAMREELVKTGGAYLLGEGWEGRENYKRKIAVNMFEKDKEFYFDLYLYKNTQLQVTM